MTTTILSTPTKEVRIGFEEPFVIIGERINPTGRQILAAEMKEGDYEHLINTFDKYFGEYVVLERWWLTS